MAETLMRSESKVFSRLSNHIFIQEAEILEGQPEQNEIVNQEVFININFQEMFTHIMNFIFFSSGSRHQECCGPGVGIGFG